MGGKGILNRKYILLAVSLILLIVVLFISFSLYEILQAPSNPDILEIEPVTWNIVTWNITRPIGENFIVTFYENVSNSYISDTVSVSLELVIYSFEARRIGDSEHLGMRLNASAIITDGFIHLMVIKFYSEWRNSSLNINEDSDRFVLRNIEIQEIDDNKEEPYIDAQADGKPTSCMLKNHFYWNFYDLNSLDHQLTVTLEATYFNGTAYRRAVIPIQLAALTSPEY